MKRETIVAAQYTGRSSKVAKCERWSWLPEIAFLESLSLLVIAQACVGARAARPSAELHFWIGLVMLIVPVAVRLASAEVVRNERIALVVLLGMAFYLVKVMHSPVAFTFPDELSHLRNVREVLETHHLFGENPVQPVTALYPGLPIVTGTLVSLSDFSTFSAGILVIGAARLVLFLALYLLFERLSDSARVAGLATLLYMTNPNFLYWTAEYAYESLALPLAIVVLFVVVRRETTRGYDRVAWTIIALLGLLGVVTTHHMTSYVLTGLLWLITVFSIGRSRGKQRGPWDLAFIALSATVAWLIFVAHFTINDLSPVLGGAVRAILDVAAREEASRQLFKSASTGYVAPLWERLTAISSVGLVALGLPFGTFEIWRRHRNSVVALVLTAVALTYFPVQLLRLTSAGWEVANRSSEFLFVGISFVLALATVKFWLSRWPGAISNLLHAGFVVTLFCGGLVAGWPPKARLPRPYIVAANRHLVEPQGVAVAKWTLDSLGPGHRVAADRSSAKLLGAYGGQHPFTGSKHGIEAMFFSDNVGPSQRNIIRKTGVQYIVSDRRLTSWDHMIGLYFFNRENSPSWELEFIETNISAKFDGQKDVSRILDSGHIAVYDVGTYHESPIE
jgi:hypothetical protein